MMKSRVVGLVVPAFAEQVGTAAGGGEQGTAAEPVAVTEILLTKREAERPLTPYQQGGRYSL